MNEHDSRKQLREDLIEALLQSAYETNTAAHQQRIESVMNCIESENVSASARDHSPSRYKSRRWKSWMSWAVAASVLFAMILGVQALDPGRQAMAAVQRSIAAAKQFVARQYLVTVTFRDSSGNAANISSDLYVQGSDRFALRHPAVLPGGNLWLGSDGLDAWLVPALGPIRVGHETGLGRWLSQREQLSTPFLHVETILARMKRGYRLEQKPETTVALDDGTTATCQHVIGTLRWKQTGNAPDRIELWSDSQTGVAIHLDVTWNEPAGAPDHKKISLVFVDSPELPDNWFSAAGHSSSSRRLLRFDSAE